NIPQKRYHAGDKIGPFEIIAFDHDKITFKWNDQPVERKLDELKPKEGSLEALSVTTPQVVQVTPGSVPRVPYNPKSLGGSSNEVGGNKADSTLGVDMGGGYHGCVNGDNSPNGTIANGYKKVVTRVLMGNSCH